MAKEKQKMIKAWLSMWALVAKSCFYKIMAVLAVMACLEGGLFYWKLRKERVFGLGSVVTYSRMSVVFTVALGAVFLILIVVENMLDTKGRYTLMRMKVAQSQFFFLKVVFNILSLAALFAVQAGMAFWMVWLCIKKGEYGGDAGQTMFLGFYMYEFLHCLLPMAETGKWVRNILMILAFSMEAADSAGKRYYWVFSVYFAVTAFCFVSPMGYNPLDAVCSVLYFIGIIVLAVGVWNKARKDGGK